MTKIPHGTVSGYTNHDCRCEQCKAAGTAYQREARAARHARGLPPGDPRHGSVNGYTNWGCRCERCKGAWAAAARAGRGER